MNKYNKTAHNLHALHALTTLLDFLRWGVSQMNAQSDKDAIYFGHGTDNSEDEAMLILSETLHLPYPIKPRYLQAHLTEEERESLITIFQRRIQERIPVPYLIHKAWFAGLEFYVDERVLIPRSPIAELITQKFSPWIESSHVYNILDLCTGSGCIAIACAHAFPNAYVDAIDISADALAVAEKNVEYHDCEGSVTLWSSDLFKAFPSKKRYDIIVSNPPYVSALEFSDLPEEYHHEPSIALLSQEDSPDGLELVETILFSAHQYLNPRGILVVEVGNSEEALVEKYPDIPFVWLEFHHGGQGVFLLTAEQLSSILIPLNKLREKS